MKKILLSAAAVLLGMSQTTLAKSTIGGIVFANSYVERIDDGELSYNRTNIDLANNSRLRIRWTNEDNVGMYIESGIGDSVRLRHAYGTWDINEHWQILAGQTSTPFAPLNPQVAMVNNSGQSVGSVSPGRQSQVRFTYKFQNRRGAFAFAFLDPNTGETLSFEDSDIGDKASILPRIDIGAAYNTFNWQIFPSAFIHRQEYDRLAVANAEEDLTIWGASLGLRRGFGPFVLAAEYGIGQNWGNTQMSQSGSPAGNNAGAVVYDDNGQVSFADNDNQNFWIDLGYRFTAGQFTGAVHFIVGQSSSEVDDLGDEYTSSMVGISAPIDLPWIARGFRIRPEVFLFDYGDDNLTSAVSAVTGDRFLIENDAGTQTVVGVQLQYTF